MSQSTRFDHFHAGTRGYPTRCRTLPWIRTCDHHDYNGLKMPRYCAVKLCKNRGGTHSEEKKRISFYPFPLQDEARLQIWVDNMKREEWVPSRHQYLCSEHFTEDCFDLRWGIRYLKHSAIPTIFHHRPDDEEKTVTTSRKNTKPKSRICDSNVQLATSPSSKRRPLILKRRVEPVARCATSFPAEDAGESQFTTPLYARCLLSETEASTPTGMVPEAAVCELIGDLPGDTEAIMTASCLNGENQPLERQLETLHSAVAVLCCEPIAQFSDAEDALQTALSQTFRIFPLELSEGPWEGPVAGEDLGEGPAEGEHISVYEHSYFRQDTDKEQLWGKIASLHTKIMELDRREESTIAEIQCLENEMANLKKDSVVFKEKQRVLEDYISSVFL
ncbi:hypothetical protein DPEC_G00082050 [Dallia pectoralis]|uniref:Uncharacterized protein n=1 Tax=Dallia pectoralis TaxID=75939 RepID=A0ACC2GZ65_DALPE|nr:hypothetical protein DPEC_G00082050 [Dallia pectoralis]